MSKTPEEWTAGAVRDWLRVREELKAIERAEHPDIIDPLGRAWEWWEKDLYTHCGMARPGELIQISNTPMGQGALDSPAYDPCNLCLAGRERNVKACNPEFNCSHTTCARMHAETKE